MESVLFFFVIRSGFTSKDVFMLKQRVDQFHGFSRRQPPFVSTRTPAKKRLKLTWLIISHYYPENQNKGGRRRCTHSGFLTLSDMFTLQTEPGESCWERLSSAACPHRWAVTHMQANMLACFPSFPSHPTEAQDRLCAQTSVSAKIHVYNCVLVTSWGQLHVIHRSIYTLHYRHDVMERVWGH